MPLSTATVLGAGTRSTHLARASRVLALMVVVGHDAEASSVLALLLLMRATTCPPSPWRAGVARRKTTHTNQETRPLPVISEEVKKVRKQSTSFGRVCMHRIGTWTSPKHVRVRVYLPC